MSDTQKTEDFLATARKRFAAASEDEKHLREKFVSDLKFASPDGDEQWDTRLKQKREAAGRPAMSFPRCHVYVQQVSNQARQQKPEIKYATRLDQDKDTADVIEGIARKIQYDSQAQVAYETAVEYSAGGSFGYYRILTEYCDDDSEDQEIRVLPVRDPLTVYGVLVPACFGQQPMYWFVVEDVPKEQYTAKYGDKFSGSLSWSEAEKASEGWIGTETVRIAEYWYVKEEKVEGKRAPKRIIKFCKTNGLEILPDSETDWPGTICNIVPVLGKQMIIEGKPHLYSVVRPQKDTQRMLNYAKSRIAETLALAPVSPYMAVEGQLDGHEDEWEGINTVPRPVVTYKAVDVNGQPAPPPQRQVYEPPIQALSAFVMQEVDDMKATTGIFDASLGNRSNEASGKAIFQRQQQADMSTMHFMDNLERSFKQGGDVIAELIPKIYDAAREITILGADEAQKVVKINEPHPDPKTGKVVHHDVANFKGKYVVTMGKAYGSKRQETFDLMQQIVQSAPNMLPMFGDVMFQASDIAGSDIVADRFKKMLPPQLQGDDQQQLPPQAQQAITQAQQHVQALNEACKQYEQQIQQLQFEKQAKVVDNQFKAQEGDKDRELKVLIAEIQTMAQNLQQRDMLFADFFKQAHSQAHDVALQHVQGVQQSQMADQQAQNALTQQQAAQAQQAATEQGGQQ